VVSGTYTLIAVKILDSSNPSNPYNVADEVKATGLTFPYGAGEFEPATTVAQVFHDDMEGGSGNWSSQRRGAWSPKRIR